MNCPCHRANLQKGDVPGSQKFYLWTPNSLDVHSGLQIKILLLIFSTNELNVYNVQELGDLRVFSEIRPGHFNYSIENVQMCNLLSGWAKGLQLMRRIMRCNPFLESISDCPTRWWHSCRKTLGLAYFWRISTAVTPNFMNIMKVPHVQSENLWGIPVVSFSATIHYFLFYYKPCDRVGL